MLRTEYLPVLEAQSKEALLAEVVRWSRGNGFDRVSAMAVVDPPAADPQFMLVSNMPARLLDVFRDPSVGKVDPVMQHCKREHVPLVWNQSTYVDVGQGAKWELQAPYGYGCGVAVAWHLPKGRHFVFGVDRAQRLSGNPAEVARLVGLVQLFAVHALEGALRILLPAPAEPIQPSLTPRELEVLRWTMEGKTAWEIGRILGLSENTVARHLHNASHKLDCVNKHQAVLRALRLGIIH